MNFATNRMNRLSVVMNLIAPLHAEMSVQLQPKEKHVIRILPKASMHNCNNKYYRPKSRY